MSYATVSLTISGPDVDPDWITMRMGVPTWRHAAKDPKLRRRLGDNAWQRAMWQISRSDLSIDSIAIEVDDLVNKVPDDIFLWAGLKDGSYAFHLIFALAPTTNAPEASWVFDRARGQERRK